MGIKQTSILTRQEFDEAIVKLRLNVSEVSKEVGIPRSYMSEFRNGDRQLRPEMLGKLKDYFESKGIEFETVAEVIEKDISAPVPIAQQSSASSPYRFWPVYLEVDQPIVLKTLGSIQDNDARIAVLFQQAAARGSGFLEDGGFTDDTKDALQEVFSLMSLNYALFRTLSGWPALGLAYSHEDPQTIRDVIFTTFQEQFEAAGLVVKSEEILEEV